MPLIYAALMIAVAYSLVAGFLLPFFDARWKDGPGAVRIAQSGALAALKTVQTFLQIALIVFGGTLAALLLLSYASPALGAKSLILVHRGILHGTVVLGKLSTAAKLVTCWIAIAALFWLAWRNRHAGIRGALEAEYKEQLAKIVEKAKAGDLEELAPTAMMDTLRRQIGAVEYQLAALPAGNSLMRAQLTAVRSELIRRLVAADFERRVDLSDVPIDDIRDSRLWPRIRLAIFSRGTQQLGRTTTTWLGRLTTAAACFLVIGVSAPAVATLGLIPTLDHLADLEILQSDKATEQALSALSGSKPKKVESPSDADEQLYNQAATQFLHALSYGPMWSQAVHSSFAGQMHPKPATAQDEQHLQNLALRDSILREYAAESPEEGLRAASSGAFDSSATDAEHDFDAFRSERFEKSRPTDTAVARISAWLRAKGEHSPSFREQLRTGLAAFKEPAQAWDFASTLVGKGLSSIIDEALPDPGERFLAKNLQKPGRKFAEEALKRVIQSKLVDFMNDIATGQSVSEALRNVRSASSSSTLFRQREARDIAAMLDSISANRAELLADAGSRPPTLLQRVYDDERDNAAKVASAMDASDLNASEIREARNSLAGGLGNYDDLFRGTQRGSDRTALTAALPTPANDNLPDLSGGVSPPSAPDDSPTNGGGASERLGASAVEAESSGGFRLASGEYATARSFTALRGSIRVGGVLIGVRPDAGRLDIRQLVWARDGANFTIRLVTANRQIIPVGTFRGSMIQQALAYAADARPVATTMTKSQFTGRILKVHVHPALVDTELGCDLISLDRFVDESFHLTPDREVWERRVNVEIGLYNLAAKFLAVPVSTESWLKGIRTSSSGHQAATMHALAFPARFDLADPRQSVFAYYKSRFDPALVAALHDCPIDDDEKFWGCIRSRLGKKSVKPESFTNWSGVREQNFTLDPGALMPAVGRTGTDPLRFMLQVAFEQTAPSDPAPWEFPPLRTQIQDGVQHLLRNDAGRTRILQDARAFTLLQRVFRSALNQQLGAGFPEERLLALMRDAKAADPVRRTPTPQWSRSVAEARAWRDAFRAKVTEERIDATLLAEMVANEHNENSDKAHICASFLEADGSDVASGDLGKRCGGVIQRNRLSSLLDHALSAAFLDRLLAPGSTARFSGGATCSRKSRSAARFRAQSGSPDHIGL